MTQTFENIRTFTATGRENFRSWFAAHAREGISVEACMEKAVDTCEDRLQRGDDLGYELSQFDTVSKNPEIWMADRTDFEIYKTDENGTEL